jgi:O-antigen ligase
VNPARVRRSVARRVSGLTKRDVPIVLTALLLATVLFQRPLVQVEGGGGIFLVRSWDVLWLLAVVASAVVVLSDGVDLRQAWSVARRGLRTPLGLFSLFAAASVLSLAVTAATFGSSHFGDSVIRAGRFVAAAFLGAVLARYLTERKRNALIVLVLGLAATAGLWAFLDWLTLTRTVATPAGSLEAGVARAAGPFGNYFSEGGSATDHWWVGAAGANGLGFWLAVALGPMVVAGAAEWAGRRRPKVLGAVAAGSVALALGLAATHSRESWLAALVGLAALAWFQRASLKERWLRVAIVAGMALVVALFAAIPSLRTRLFESFQPGTFGFETGPRARLDSWVDGLQWGWDRFPIGWGVGGIEEHAELFGHQSAENMFIQAWASMGVVGAALLIACCVQGLRTSAAAVRRRPASLAASFSLAFFAVFVAHGMFGNTIADPTIEALLALALGVNLQLIRRPEVRSSA